MTVSGVKLSGSEPNLRMSASWFASAWVKPLGAGPVICTLPAVIGELVSGAVCTSPSSTSAVWSRYWSFRLPDWAPA